VGAVLGAVGGVAGAFAGYEARTRLVKALKVPDLVIAPLHDSFFFIHFVWSLYCFERWVMGQGFTGGCYGYFKSSS